MADTARPKEAERYCDCISRHSCAESALKEAVSQASPETYRIYPSPEGSQQACNHARWCGKGYPVSLRQGLPGLRPAYCPLTLLPLPLMACARSRCVEKCLLARCDFPDLRKDLGLEPFICLLTEEPGFHRQLVVVFHSDRAHESQH